MLKTTRFCVWSYRWAVPGMAAVVFLISLINLTGSHAREAMTGYITSMGILYLTLVPFLFSVLQTPQTVRFALTMGQTRRSLWAELPCITLGLALFADAGMCAVFAVQCRIFLGQWLPDAFVPALFVLLVAASVAFTSLGQLLGLVGHRFGGWGWVCGSAALLVMIAAAVLGVVFAPRSVQLGLVLLFFEPARAAAAAGASALGALAVCGAVQAASWLLLRHICVK